MRILPPVTPTDEQLKVLGDVKSGFRLIRGAAGSGKTTTSLLRLGELTETGLKRLQRHGLPGPLRVLVLTFNRTLEGYIRELAEHSIAFNDTLELEVTTFARWARSLVGTVDILGRDDAAAILRPLLRPLTTSSQMDYFIDEVAYLRGRFEPGHLNDYLDAVREGRGIAPRVERSLRQKLLADVLPAYETAKAKRGRIDWNDLAVMAGSAMPDLLYDVVVVDEAQDFSANQVRAVLRHLDDDHITTFVLDAVQRIYPQHFKWSEVGIRARPEIIYTLSENYRNTKQIAAFALPLLVGLPQEDDGTLPDFESCSRVGNKPLVVLGKYSEQLEIMFDEIDRTADLKEESVAILQPRGGGWFSEARRFLERRGIEYCELTRENEWPKGPEVVALCTIHSAKGLEFDHVLLPGVSQQVTPHGTETGDGDLDRLRRMYAMAIGRARNSVALGYKPGEESSVIGYLKPGTFRKVVA